MTTADAILTAESDTIQSQIDNVSTTIASQQRVTALNESYSKKMAAYTRMVMVIVFALAIAVLLNILKSKFPIIPDAVVTFAYIIIFSSSAVYSMYAVSDVISRENTDFDKLALNPPAGILTRKISQNQSESGDLDLLPGYCIGKDCCTGAAAWDEPTSKCVTSCSAGYAYISGTDVSTCDACAVGKYSANAGATTCTNCAAGTYSATAGATACTSCAAGTYSTTVGATADTTCNKCAVNTYSTTVGATAATTCLQCPVGTNSVAGSTGCSTTINP